MTCLVRRALAKAALVLRGALSSVGRASRLHREGQRFEPVSAHQDRSAHLTFILQQALETHSVPMRGISFKTGFCSAVLASVLFCSPAHATLSVSPFTAKKAPAALLLKNKGQRESASDSRQQNCKPSVRSMTEGQPSRNCNCPKPRPILM